MRPFIFGLLLSYGTLGIFLLYATLHITNIMHVSPMQLVAWYLPMSIGGCFLAISGGFLLHKIPGTLILFISTLAVIINSLLFALQPPDAGYWPWVFPAMCCATIAIDLLFSAASIFLSTSLPKGKQGLAGALSNVLLQLGVALLLGFADIVVSETGGSERESYKHAFWFELGCGALAMVVFLGFVRMGRAESDFTYEEKREEEMREQGVAR
ncbi:hypothetical protein LTR37_011204 [Vermiconidia calcicola]|uniref:Uncharacterized protein n=1 Tax=Vermiconidia calcicola TaxID=1690605 RepID=A0ACC3N2T0_9PEZI|nr:hypothetical protein LTR37_011204 [Vermiconidia calcicola]